MIKNYNELTEKEKIRLKSKGIQSKLPYLSSVMTSFGCNKNFKDVRAIEVENYLSDGIHEILGMGWRILRGTQVDEVVSIDLEEVPFAICYELLKIAVEKK